MEEKDDPPPPPVPPPPPQPRPPRPPTHDRRRGHGHNSFRKAINEDLYDLARHQLRLSDIAEDRAGRVACPKCGSLNWLDEKSGGTFENPEFTICCQKGLVQLNPLAGLPLPLFSYFNPDESVAQRETSTHFFIKIRNYNNLHAMASMQANIDNTLTGGITQFKINGKVRHKIGALEPNAGENAKFAQIYVLHSTPQQSAIVRQIERRLEIMPPELQLRETVIRGLTEMLNAVNPYVAQFKAIIREDRQQGNLPDMPDLIMYLRSPEKTDNDPRRYNLPTSTEVAAFVPETISRHHLGKVNIRQPTSSNPLTSSLSRVSSNDQEQET